MTEPKAHRWNFQAEPEARAALAVRCTEVESELAALPPEAQSALLIDTRPLHLRLFGTIAPGVAGTYRGTPGSPVAETARAVFLARPRPGLRQRDPCPPPQAVAVAMASLGDRIAAVWACAPSGDAAYDALAEVTHGFLAVHPYPDGNGHVCRLMATALAPRLGLIRRPDWTAHPRPYDHLMSLCLQWYPEHPGLLSAHLRRWFACRS